MPTKKLPVSADLTHLKHQAKDLLSDFRAGKMSAYQRIREFHPKLCGLSDDALSMRTFSLSDALVSIAREYGYPSWPRLKEVVSQASGQDAALNHNDRIDDDLFRQAVDFLDEGNEVLLRQHLTDHPELVHQKMHFEGGNYFSEPTLLEFIAENPTRQNSLPDNIVEIARIILEAGAKDHPTAVNETLILVASGRIVREHGVQQPLLGLLCDSGVDPNVGIVPALAQSELDAVRYLLGRGASLDISTAAALDMRKDVSRLIKSADEAQLQLALSLAALHNRGEVLTALLKAGADPNRYNPPGGHMHCTPLHSAAVEGHLDCVTALIDGGARLDICDIHHNATALGWAEHMGHDEVASYLKSKL